MKAHAALSPPRSPGERKEDQKEFDDTKKAREFIRGPSVSVWEDSAAALRASLGPHTFNQWIKTARAVWVGDVLTVATLDDCHAQALNTIWAADIREAIGMDFEAVDAFRLAESAEDSQ